MTSCWSVALKRMLLDLQKGMSFSRSVMSTSLHPHGLQYARLPCPSPSPRFCSNSCPLSQWCHPTISPSVVPFFLQSFPASGSLPMSQIFTSVARVLELSFSISPSNEFSELISFRNDWFDLLAVQGTFKNFSTTTVWKHQLFGVQPSSWSNSHVHTWLLEKP